jgi:glycosyltransferase involved in cell wall biosynthesis
LKSIAICTVGELFGGVERHVLAMLRALPAQGISVLPILFHNGELAARMRELGIEPVILPDDNIRLIRTSKQLARLLQERGIQIVHAHGYKATVCCALARRWHPFALVKTEHGLPEHGAAYSPGALRSRLYHSLDRLATNRSRATLCYVTQDLLTRDRGLRPGVAVHVVRNGTSEMDPRQWARPTEFRSGRFNALTLGRLEPVKALHLAIDAICARDLPPDVHLHIIGSGPCEGALRKRSDSLGVASRVHFLGYRRDIYGFIAHCDALLIPSMHEGLPYTVLEAMALGRPIIATRVGGLAEVLEHEVTALLVPSLDVGAIVHAIARLHDSPELGVRLGAQAQRVQRALYSLRAMSEHYQEIYRTVLPGGRPAVAPESR